MATKLIGECVTKVQWITAESPALAPFAARVSAAVSNRCARKPGWAKRPGHGEGYGENTVGKYFSELMSYYMIGVLDKSRRMNAPIMLENLRSQYPRRYDLPSEQFVIRFISTQNARVKELQRRGEPLQNLSKELPAKKGRMAEKYVTALTEVLKSTGLSLRLADGKARLIEHMGLDKEELPGDFPEDLQLKRKVSSLKSKLRKETH